MHIQERISIDINVRLRLRDRFGRVIEERAGHNVFLRKGAFWLTRTLPAALFPASHDSNTNLTGDNGQVGNVDVFSPIGGTYRPRYIGVGVGGLLQTISPPGPGGQAEEASVSRLERPVQVRPGPPAEWYKQLLPHDDLNDPEQWPDERTIRFRAIFGYDDISFPGCEDTLGTVYGTDVPVSEIGLYSSQASLTEEPDGTGLLCYHIFRPLSVTPNFMLEVDWDWRIG